MKVLGALIVALLVVASTRPSQALPKKVACNAASLTRLMHDIARRDGYPSIPKKHLRCYLKINLHVCKPCGGSTSCMQKHAAKVGDKLLRSLPECRGTKRRLRVTSNEFENFREENDVQEMVMFQTPQEDVPRRLSKRVSGGTKCKKAGEAFSKWNAHCEGTCDNPRPMCKAVVVPGCKCVRGYVRDERTNKCIPPEYCDYVK